MNIAPVISAKHRLVGVPPMPELLHVYPNAQRVTYSGNDFMLVPHDSDTTRFLRNLGVDIPAPVTAQYDWMNGKPFDVQKRTVELLTLNRRAYVLNGMGTGKTKSALWAWHFLYTRGEAKKLLVVAPLSTLNFTWGREIFQTLPGMKVQILHGVKSKRLQKFADETADIYIINHDGLALIAGALEERKDVDSIVLDELAVYRNGTAARTKIVKKVVAGMKWAWGLTGSPTPNLPTDAWAQCSILTPNTVPKYFRRFQDEVMTKVSQFRYSGSTRSCNPPCGTRWTTW
jgi:SNF2 family DNA or RNA helicase